MNLRIYGFKAYKDQGRKVLNDPRELWDDMLLTGFKFSQEEVSSIKLGNVHWAGGPTPRYIIVRLISNEDKIKIEKNRSALKDYSPPTAHKKIQIENDRTQAQNEIHVKCIELVAKIKAKNPNCKVRVAGLRIHLDSKYHKLNSPFLDKYRD